MSAVIDDKVVEMQFDNSHFERNVSKTLGTLDKLKQSLNLTGATKGLAEVDAAAKNCNIGALGQAAETVQMKFSALQAIAVGALMNIGAQAVNAGAALVKSIAIEPITQGFQEYETQMNSVQTILANTSHQGTTLKDVTGALDELNTYADQTIYNFTEMTRNIGTFTAAGVDLDTSTSAIKGIANLAAVSGSSSQQASTAMYQLSQALAAGRVSLMDWNSVVNAGMGGKVFQDALIRTSEVMNTGAKDAIEKYGSFRESLTQGEWLTTDVLTATLNQFTMSAEKGSEEWKAFKKELMDQGYTAKQAEEILTMANTATDAATKVKTFTQLIDTLKESVGSGWAKTWQIIFGDFEEAKELWTAVSDTLGGFINKSSEARNELLQGWKDLGGRQDLIDGFANAFKALVSFAKPIAEAFRDIFPSITVENLKSFSEGFKKLMGYFILGETASKNLKDTFKGLFSIIDIIRRVFVGVFEAIVPLFGGFDNLGGGILGVTGAIGRFITKIHDVIAGTDIIGKVFGAIGGVIKGFIDVLRGLDIIEKVKARFSGLVDAIKGAFSKLKGTGDENPIVGFLKNAWESLSTIGGAIVDAVKTIANNIKEAFSGGNFSALTDILNVGVLGVIAVAIKKFMGSMEGGFGIFESITEAFGGLKEAFEGVGGLLDNVKGSLEAWQQSVKAKMIMEIAKAVAVLAVALLVISSIDSDKLAGSLAAVTAMFADLMASMALFNKMDALGTGVIKACGAMISISIAVLILAMALKTIAELKFDQLVKGLIGVLSLTGLVMAVVSKLGTMGGGKVMKGAGQLILLALAIKLLAGVCEDLGALSWKELAKGLIGVGGLMAAVGIFLGKAKFQGKIMSSAIGILILATAIKTLASACKNFASMRVEDIIKGLGGIGILLGVVAGFTKFASGTGGMLSVGIGLIAVASAMKIFAEVVRTLGNMKVEDLIKGLGGMAGALVIMAGALRLLPAKSMIGVGIGMIVIAEAMVTLTEAISNMGGMRWQDLAKGLLGLGVAMGIMAVALKAMNGTLAGSAALLVAAVAMGILGGTLAKLGGLSWEDVAKSLLTLAGAIAVIGAAAVILTPLLPALLGLGAVFTLIGAGVLGLGAGLMLAGLGLTAIAAGLAALVGVVSTGAVSIVNAFVTIIKSLATAIIEAAPDIGKAALVLINELVKVIVEGAPVIINGVLTLLVELLGALDQHLPTILQKVANILFDILDFLTANIGQFVQKGVELVVAFINGIAQSLGMVIQAAFDLIVAFINGIADGIANNTPALIDAVHNLILALLDAAVAVLLSGPSLFLEAGNRLMDNGLIKGIGNKAAALRTKVGNAVKNAKNAIVNKAGEFLSSGKTLFQSVINGVGSKVGSLVSKAGSAITSAKNAVVNKASGLFSAGSDLIQGLINGIGAKANDLVAKAEGVVNNAIQAAKNLLGINSPSRVFMEIGRYVDEGMIIGLEKYAGGVSDASADVAQGAVDGVSNTLSRIGDVLGSDLNSNPTITPVLDLTEIQNGAGRISSILGGQSVSLDSGINSSANRASSIGFGGSGDSEIVNAINKLRGDISGMSKTENNVSFNGVSFNDDERINNAVLNLIYEISRKEAMG